MNQLLLATIVILVTGFQGTAQDKKYRGITNTLNSYLSIQKEKTGFNGIVKIAKDDKVIFEKIMGLSSIEHQVLLKPNSKFKIASISKTFTASLIAMANDEGLLGFQDKITGYIPDLPPAFQNITIHHLLSHSSGIAHHDKIKGYWAVKSKLNLTPDQILKEIADIEILFEPGTQMKYTSTGYYLLALILEKVYQKPYLDLIKNKILIPFHMTSTGIVNNLDIVTDMASGYHKLRGDYLVTAPYRDYSFLKGAGDMYSTTEDLLKWSNANLSGKFLTKETREQMFSPNLTSDTKENSSYGYGWFIKTPTETPLVYHHGGGTWGYSSYMAIYPKEQLTIIILSNVSLLPMESLWRGIEKIVFNIPFEMPVLENVIETNGAVLIDYAGNYISEPGGRKLNITLHDSKLFAQLTGNPPFEIFFKGNKTFFGKTIDATFTFTADGQGKIAVLNVDRKGQVYHFRKY